MYLKIILYKYKEFRSLNMKAVFDKGVNDMKGMSTTWQYKLWINMLNRCYGDIKENPSYENCQVSEEFLILSNFVSWVNSIGRPEQGWCLDKDLLGDGKIYSKETCCFLPSIVNLLIKRSSDSGLGLPKGVSQQPGSGRFKASRSKYGKVKIIGTYATPEEAYEAYIKETETYAKELANTYISKLDPRAFNALLKWSPAAPI